uniref:Zinc finger and BTB domain containing 22a n=1 Tax=Poecilia reticulata TaxID=8081 RepID=A0A3P9NVQ5_POERE
MQVKPLPAAGEVLPGLFSVVMDATCCDAAVTPPSLTVQVCFPGVRAAVLDNLNRQREEGRLCDLSIQVQGQVFRAHRCVLAASSPYFHDQVLLKNVTTVSLPSVLDPVAFQSVLSSAYTGQLSIIHDDIVNYVTVASFLQMWHIVDKCTEILKRPRPSADILITTEGNMVTSMAPCAWKTHDTFKGQSSALSVSSSCFSCRSSGSRRRQTPERRPVLSGPCRRAGRSGSAVRLLCFGSFDEIEDGTGHVSQRPLLSPDFNMADGNWPSSSAAFPPPPPSPPTPSSSSSASGGGGYAGKVHLCHCGKAYTLKSMRDRHVKMQHLNLRPFGCPVCTKSFKMKHHLTKHLKTHGGLRPYECSLCGKKVVWRDSFLRHQARCQRLASAGGATAAQLEDRYGLGFDDGEVFVAAGQVKVEDDGMGGLLGDVPGILGAPPQDLGSVGHVFKEEAAERFSES